MIPVCEGFAIRQSHGLQRIPLTKRGEIAHRPSFPCYFCPPGLPGALSVVVAPAINLDQLDDEARYAAQHATDRPRQPEQAGSHGAPVVMQHPRPQKQ